MVKALLEPFNSIKVQLRPPSDTQADIKALIFQFHKGTIKAMTDETLLIILTTFQFHKGTIKAVANSVFKNSYHIFQFHKGTIKT